MCQREKSPGPGRADGRASWRWQPAIAPAQSPAAATPKGRGFSVGVYLVWLPVLTRLDSRENQV